MDRWACRVKAIAFVVKILIYLPILWTKLNYIFPMFLSFFYIEQNLLYFSEYNLQVIQSFTYSPPQAILFHV